MHPGSHESLEKIYPISRALLGPDGWGLMVKVLAESANPAGLETHHAEFPGFLPELALLEWTKHRVATAAVIIPRDVEQTDVNPTLEVIHLSWKLSGLLGPHEGALPQPEPGEEWALLWRDPQSGETRVEAATQDELLVLKMLVDEVTPEEAAAEGKVPMGAVDAAMAHCAEKGLTLMPPSRIRRDPAAFPPGAMPEHLTVARSFGLQWHLTHTCDLHCKHCYDRSKRGAPSLEQAIAILDDYRMFCHERNVAGHVCLTGGNPLLYPHFYEVYRAAADRGFGIAILGNATARGNVEKMIEIKRPGYYQVSLEGMPEHNDFIRGAGYFDRVIAFLQVLRELGVSPAVMLTLTKDNIGQVLALAERLRGLTDHFTFNRLSPVGEGASLDLPTPQQFASFLESYVDAAQTNPIMGYKDNLINIVLRKRGLEMFDGCTGFGCGAAFNFLVVLPDGEVHACRKFPTPLGNVFHQSLSQIYDSDLARRYRSGCSECRSCVLRPACGGCMAIAHGHGQNIFEERDPFCFIEAAAQGAASSGELVGTQPTRGR